MSYHYQKGVTFPRLLNFVHDIVINQSERARAEVRRYTEEEPSADNPLEWWKKSHTRFPYLPVLARNTWPYQQRPFLHNEHLVLQGTL